MKFPINEIVALWKSGVVGKTIIAFLLSSIGLIAYMSMWMMFHSVFHGLPH